jgi:hypothetical protein
MIFETLKVEGSDTEISFSIGEIYRDENSFFKAEVIFYVDSKQVSKIQLPGMSEFGVLTHVMSYIGNRLRGFVKEKNVVLDLDGLTLDEFVPLSRSQRLIWDES